jgi:hypothetical protein
MHAAPMDATDMLGEDSEPERDEIRSNSNREGSALPLPLAGEGWGGGAAASRTDCVERAPTHIASFDAI